MNLTDDEKAYVAKLATRCEKYARNWRHSRIIVFLMLCAGIALFTYSHKQVAKYNEMFPSELTEKAKHIPADMEMVDTQIHFRVNQLIIFAVMSLNSLMFLGLGIFLVVRTIIDWNKDKTYLLTAKILKEISQQSVPGYPPQGVGSPEP